MSNNTYNNTFNGPIGSVTQGNNTHVDVKNEYTFNNQMLPQNILDELENCVKYSGVSKNEFNAFSNAIQELLQENADLEKDVLFELAHLSANYSDSRNPKITKKLQDSVALTNGLISLGKTAVGIVQGNPGLTLSGVLDTTKNIIQ